MQLYRISMIGTMLLWKFKQKFYLCVRKQWIISKIKKELDAERDNDKLKSCKTDKVKKEILFFIHPFFLSKLVSIPFFASFVVSVMCFFFSKDAPNPIALESNNEQKSCSAVVANKINSDKY